MADAKHYGLIAVMVYRMSSSDKIHHRYDGNKPIVGLAQEVPEKAFKGATVTSCTTFQQQPTDRPEWADGRPESVFQDPLKRPCAIFEFRYRSKDGVLQRPNPVDNMSIEELRRLAFIGYNHENNDMVKQDPDHKVKHEDGEDVANRKRSASGTEETPRKRYKETVRDDGKVEVDLE
ncbi:hypothetical protein PG984_014038 [Apiospora sp. TS-2023a]